MKNLLLILLLIITFTVTGNTHAQTKSCDTASELMAINLGQGQFQQICKKIVASDQACKKIAADKRMDCSSKDENEIFSSKHLSGKIFACMKGFIWDSMVELGNFVVDLVKIYVKSEVDSVTTMFKFLTDSEYREKTIAKSGKTMTKAGKLGKAFLNSSAQYFAREYPKNLAMNLGSPMLALGKTLLEPLMKFLSEAVQSAVAEYVPQYQCMNGPAKLNTLCKLAGDFVMPPVFLLGYLKYGVKGLATLAKSSKVLKFQKSFTAMNEVHEAAVATKSLSVEIKSASPSLKAASVRAAKTERRTARSIIKATEVEAIDIARTEKAARAAEEVTTATHHKNLSLQYENKSYPILENGPLESESFERMPTILEGNFRPKLQELAPNETTALLRPSGKPLIYDGQEYFEFPNSTALKVKDAAGKEREFILTRGVRKYETKINLEDGSISPQGYVSDVLLFEMKDGKATFVNTIMKSSPEKNFLFEDPRISVLYEKDGAMKIFLSGTDYSPHVPGSNNPDVMNRYVQLKVDAKGTPQPVKVNAETRRPKFLDLSPKPFKVAGGDMIYFDAKNATIAQNEAGQIVVRTRLRPDFGNPYFKKVTGGETWKYAEQAFVFDSYADLEKYNWEYAIEDLYDKNLAQAAADGRLKPKAAKTLIKDKDLPELYKSKQVIPSKGKGLGPGTIPVRVRREGNVLYTSDAVNAPETVAGIIPNEMLSSFPVKAGEVKFVTFDHEIRYFEDTRGGSSFVKRHYTASIKLFDQSLTKIDGYYSDVIQPKTLHEIGDNAGIADLQHVYPMGRTLNTQKGITRVTVYGGASDAHTTAYNFDLVKLLTEMGTDSPRRLTGQVR